MATKIIIVCDYCGALIGTDTFLHRSEGSRYRSEGSRWDACSARCFGRLEDDSLREAEF